MTDAAAHPAAPDAARQQRYTAVAIALHWIIAFSILGLIAVGWTMGELEGEDRYNLIQLHKSFGITVFLLSVARLLWRLMNPPPPEPPMAKWQLWLANTVHTLFYVLILVMPLTGWIMASASDDAPTRYFNLVDIRLPGIPALPAETRDGLEDTLESVHSTLAWVIISLFVIHVAGALKHQLVDKDGVLARMAPGIFGRTAGPPDNGHGALWAFGASVLIFASIVGFSLSTARPNEGIAAGAETEGDAENASNAPAWTVDPARSTLKFRFAYMGQDYEGAFPEWSARIQLDTDAAPNQETPVDGYVRVVIPVGKIRTGEDYFDGNVTQGDWFDVTNHPEAVFEVTGGVYKLSATEYEATGVLKLKGVDYPVRLPFTLAVDGATATMHGEASLNRLDLGIGKGTLAQARGDEEWVRDAVQVVIDIVATRQ
jgi:cytochrome b561/polyisoprenoid-binding protein YceI